MCGLPTLSFQMWAAVCSCVHSSYLLNSLSQEAFSDILFKTANFFLFLQFFFIVSIKLCSITYFGYFRIFFLIPYLSLSTSCIKFMKGSVSQFFSELPASGSESGALHVLDFLFLFLFNFCVDFGIVMFVCLFVCMYVRLFA